MNTMLSKTRLLAVALAMLGALTALAADIPLDPNLVALFADLHVTMDNKNQHQRAGLERCVREVLALNPRPANVLFYGDLSIDRGATNDYRMLKTLVKPLDDAGVRWHAAFGNHDRRAPFFAIFPECAAASLVPDRLVSLVETPHADFVLLDSCLEGPVHGGLDDAQRAWLRTVLSGRSKPVFVGAHHPLHETGIATLLAATPACKGYVYGHNHNWLQQETSGVQTLCLPSTGHWGDIGYVLVRLSADEAVFSLKQHDYYTPRPAATPEQAKPEWAARAKRNDGSQWRVPLKGEESGFVPLFNGRDLTGWVPCSIAPETFFVRDGLIITTGDPIGTLRTEKMYENFIIDFEWRHMKSGGNSGLFIWADALPVAGSPFSRGIEIQVLDPGFNVKGKNEWYSTHGDVFAVNGAKLTVAGRISPNGQRSFPAEERTRPSPEWNHYRVAAINGDISLSVNGKEVTIAYGASPRKGYLMLESEGSECQFRNIRIKELPSTQPKPEEIAREGDGFVPLFNGVDLRGWKVPEGDNGHWKVIDGVIDYDARSEAAGDKNLWSQQAFKDFDLVVDWRIKETPYTNPNARSILPDGSDEKGPDGKVIALAIPDSDSGVFLRGSGKYQVNIWCWPIGSGEMYGVRLDRAMPPEVRAGVTPKLKADNPVGKWNRFEIAMRGNTVRVLLNGKAVLPGVAIPNLPESGPIALQHHGSMQDGVWNSPPSLMQFRNIFIRETSLQPLKEE
ncbi:MAG: DUF1080 domain-containing protein [Kiritimatiellae bacterium]|jgi:hypothetical protein|nr:DUF1080 domain-containing protein [Kiritimatiellia bacterium]MDD2347246.1 DUF1080 domain-containing protein [Kiritimatiellia bacterium]MDD3583522.1 DUF1080 domain-containing protein [Kiritimatiellia bacterium]HHU13576.1 DUF1080 domain-containing protein [Lentisphaerota bacterium]HON47223.1 DUF1080 domain-containing protein [Kiritimatiellia bacterium]